MKFNLAYETSYGEYLVIEVDECSPLSGQIDYLITFYSGRENALHLIGLGDLDFIGAHVDSCKSSTPERSTRTITPRELHAMTLPVVAYMDRKWKLRIRHPCGVVYVDAMFILNRHYAHES